jgi:hypothetical protein
VTDGPAPSEVETGQTRIERDMIRFYATQSGPLEGVRVLDLSRLVAGNMLSLQLADLGAEVTKVEAPQGDPLRDWLDDGEPLFWKVYARNKRSIVLNLRVAAGKEALLRLAERQGTVGTRPTGAAGIDRQRVTITSAREPVRASRSDL